MTIVIRMETEYEIVMLLDKYIGTRPHSVYTLNSVKIASFPNTVYCKIIISVKNDFVIYTHVDWVPYSAVVARLRVFGNVVMAVQQILGTSGVIDRVC